MFLTCEFAVTPPNGAAILVGGVPDLGTEEGTAILADQLGRKNTFTARRVALVKQRVRENTRRRQRREVISLSAFCLMLFTALAGAADALIVRGQTAAWGVFGAMLLREDAGGYVLVAVVSFAAAAAITALCFRLRIRENQKKDGTDKPDPQEQEEKSQ